MLRTLKLAALFIPLFLAAVCVAWLGAPAWVLLICCILVFALFLAIAYWLPDK